MSKQIIILFVFLTGLVFVGSVASAEAPRVGKKAAARYFQNKGVAQADYSEPQRYPSTIDYLSPQDHYLAVGLNTFVNSSAYNWGNGTKQQDVGRKGLDLTYRLAQEYELFDQIIRVSYNDYETVGQKTSKMSFMYGMTFPDAGSQFPLYFGLVGGPGIFFKQVDGESAISFDYQLFAGLRLFNLYESAGFFVEGGLRNHLQITSDGQLNGTYFSAGAVFTF